MIFLIIQTSIPLGLGLLGALSFVRFRTPIKDPPRSGFCSYSLPRPSAWPPANIIPTTILFAVVFVTLWVHYKITERVSVFESGQAGVFYTRGLGETRCDSQGTKETCLPVSANIYRSPFINLLEYGNDGLSLHPGDLKV